MAPHHGTSRLDAFLKRARNFGSCDANYTMAELLDKADARLLGLYKDQNIVFIIFYQSTVVLYGVETQRCIFECV